MDRFSFLLSFQSPLDSDGGESRLKGTSLRYGFEPVSPRTADRMGRSLGEVQQGWSIGVGSVYDGVYCTVALLFSFFVFFWNHSHARGSATRCNLSISLFFAFSPFPPLLLALAACSHAADLGPWRFRLGILINLMCNQPVIAPSLYNFFWVQGTSRH